MGHPLLAIGFLRRLAAVPLGELVVWSALVTLSIAVVALLRMRWGQSRPLQKCAVLSLLVHLVFACLAMTVRIVVGHGDGGGNGIGPTIHVRIVDDAPIGLAFAPTGPDKSNDLAPPPLLEAPPAQEAEPEETTPAEPEPDVKDVVTEEPEPPPVEPVSLPALDDVEIVPEPTIETAAEPELPKPAESVATATPPVITHPTLTPAAPPFAASVVASPVVAAGPSAAAYALRTASGRLGLVEQQGGNAQTEEAVTCALNWLAIAQSPEGRWDADRHGAGKELKVLGQDRHGAGRDADTGVSALAILAFLGAGHSHLQGDHQTTVHQGLDFLLREQGSDGNLFGNASLYAQMYCHSMATFALAEAMAMTGDTRLESAVKRGINFSVRAQNTATGGWRYRPGDTGDTSQLGWQLMSLASSQRAGLPVPSQTWDGADRFLRSVRRGKSGGLASYRPDSPTTTSMTAEALYCRLLMSETVGTTIDDRAASEATGQILAMLPDADQVNLYYWYYATLALHHRQQASDQAAEAWHAWNDALTTVLLAKQVHSGQDAGSWNTECLWGGYGGRVYTTAMSAMCLEVYYRYAPVPRRNDWIATRPGLQPSAD